MALSVEIGIWNEDGSQVTLTAEDNFTTVGLDGNVKISVGSEVFYINNITLLRLGIAMASKCLLGLEAWRRLK